MIKVEIWFGKAAFVESIQAHKAWKWLTYDC